VELVASKETEMERTRPRREISRDYRNDHSENKEHHPDLETSLASLSNSPSPPFSLRIRFFFSIRLFLVVDRSLFSNYSELGKPLKVIFSVFSVISQNTVRTL